MFTYKLSIWMHISSCRHIGLYQRPDWGLNMYFCISQPFLTECILRMICFDQEWTWYYSCSKSLDLQKKCDVHAPHLRKQRGPVRDNSYWQYPTGVKKFPNTCIYDQLNLSVFQQTLLLTKCHVAIWTLANVKFPRVIKKINIFLIQFWSGIPRIPQ